MPKKIAIVGPESTGKSSLCQDLATFFRSPKVDEVARQYLSDLGRPYQKQDVETIAKKQIETEQKCLDQNPEWLFCDTNLLVIKIWMEHAYGTCPDWILERVKNYDYDFTLLLIPDLGWTQDPLREHPHHQLFFYQWFESELRKLGCLWVPIGGEGTDRMANALSAIQENFPAEFQVQQGLIGKITGF